MSDQGEADRLIGTVTKNTREHVAVQLRTYTGHRFIDVRVMASTAEGGTTPTGKGVALKPDELLELIGLLQQAHAAAAKAGWCTDDVP